jgi:hypothetical protein
LFSGSLAALLLASTIGADMHGEAQCALLLRHGFDEQLCDGILRYPTTTVRDSMQAVADAVREFGYLRFYAIAGVLAALPLLPLFASMPGWRRRPLLVGSGAAFAFTLPMFAIAVDWGRLLNIHVMALAVVILAFGLDDRETTGSVFGVKRAWLRLAILLALALYLTTWSIRHCCADAFTAGVFASDD